MTIEEYRSIESDFRRMLVDSLGDSICLYCVTGSLGRMDIMPGWSDIDVLLVVREYTPDLLKSIGDAVKAFSSRIKIGVTPYSVLEFNDELFIDGKTIQSIGFIIAGVLHPEILKKDIIIKPVSPERGVAVDSFDLVRFLVDVKKELMNGERYDEKKVYKLVHTSMKILLRRMGIDIVGYEKVLKAAFEHLPNFRVALVTPQQIISAPEMRINRYDGYVAFLEWVKNHARGII